MCIPPSSIKQSGTVASDPNLGIACEMAQVLVVISPPGVVNERRLAKEECGARWAALRRDKGVRLCHDAQLKLVESARVVCPVCGIPRLPRGYDVRMFLEPGALFAGMLSKDRGECAVRSRPKVGLIRLLRPEVGTMVHELRAAAEQGMQR